MSTEFVLAVVLAGPFVLGGAAFVVQELEEIRSESAARRFWSLEPAALADALAALEDFGPMGAVMDACPLGHEATWLRFQAAVATGTVQLPAHVWRMDLPWSGQYKKLAARIPVGAVVGFTSNAWPIPLAAKVSALLDRCDRFGPTALEALETLPDMALGTAVESICSAYTDTMTTLSAATHDPR